MAINIQNTIQQMEDHMSAPTEVNNTWTEKKAKEYGLTLSQPAPITTQVQPPMQQLPTPNQTSPIQSFYSQTQQQSNPNPYYDLNNLIQLNQQNADANFMQQKAQLDSALEAQLAQLKMAYQQAVESGEISVRDAEIDFQAQKQEIEKQAYADSQRTNLYSQDMGIQNSQQMVGLMQGDNARTNSLINTNMTTRDKRVADIKTKLNTIKNQQAIDINKAQSEHMYNVLGAKASTQQQATQNMFNLLQDDYSFNRQAQQDDKMFNKQAKLGFDMLDATHQKDLEKMSINFGNEISKMNLQQGFDVAKMNLSFKNELSAMATQHGYQKELSSIEQSNKFKLLEKEQALLFKQMDKELKLKREQLKATYTPGTPEYLSAERELELDSKRQANAMMAQSAADVWSQVVLNNPNLPEYGSEGLTEPYNYYDSPSDLVFPGFPALQNWITGYDKNKEAYDKEQQAIKMMENYFNKAGFNNFQWTTNPKISSYERYLQGYQK